jgi:hypothetical protein
VNDNHPRDEATLSRLEDPAMIARVVALLLSYGFRWPLGQASPTTALPKRRDKRPRQP